jgi:hypothetical protein
VTDGPPDCGAAAAARHYVEKCSCGAVVAQCRCPAPDKEVRVRPLSCKACREAAVAVFPAEVEAGLAEVVRATASTRVTAAARHNPGAELPDVVLAHIRATAGDLSLPDLFPVRARLVTTTLNRNDDYFLADETWAARNTPADKPWNYEHEAADVIGHMTGSVAVDADGKAVADDSPPAFFHVDFDGVLYRHWPGCEAKQERTDAIVAALREPTDADQWCVSMECRFKGFDYVLVPVEGKALAFAKAKVVPRGDDTAFLTKHLRAYGGGGTYKGYRVGRVLRNITFSGVGLVRTPANPDSVVLSAGGPAAAGGDFSRPAAASGYGPDSGNTQAGTNQESQAMTEAEIKALQTQLAEAKAQLAEATKANWDKQLAEAKADAAKAADAARAALDAARAEAETAKAQAKAAADELAKAKAALEAAERAKAELQAAVDAQQAAAEKAAAEARLADRVTRVKAAYGLSTDDEAKATAETLAALPDEAFEKHLKSMAGYAPKSTTAKPGETRVTDKPAPMGGGAKPVKASLDGTTPVEGDAALTAAGDTAESEDEAIASEMLNFFGHAEAADEGDDDRPARKSKKAKARK